MTAPLAVMVVALLAAPGAGSAASTAPSAPAARASRVALEPVLSGYSRPVLITHAPGEGRVIYIVEQTGAIKRATFEGGRWRKLGTFLDLRSRVSDPDTDGGERGLLGLAFHPDYQRNGLLYVDYTRAGRGAADGDTVIVEYRRAEAGRADPSSRRLVMTIDQPYANHNGGHLAFGPDGFLYVASGDGGSAGDPHGNGQRLDTRLGKLLRIDPRDPDGPGGRRFGVPASNPRVGRSGLDEIWAWGLRNPWRFSFDRQTGDLWIGDVGQNAWEEVDRSRADGDGTGAGRGLNYGWDRCEGNRRYPSTGSICRFGTRPVHAYRHGGDSCSVTGGHVHRGPAGAAWRGLYVAGDFCGRLFVLGPDGSVRLARDSGRSISSFGEDAAGRIYAADLTAGRIYLVRFQGPRP
jgi:glucose/arabinose dehydrogenase